MQNNISNCITNDFDLMLLRYLIMNLFSRLSSEGETQKGVYIETSKMDI